MKYRYINNQTGEVKVVSARELDWSGRGPRGFSPDFETWTAVKDKEKWNYPSLNLPKNKALNTSVKSRLKTKT